MATMTSKDPVLAGCLFKLRSGDMTALLILADRLEEVGHQQAKAIRKLCKVWHRNARECWHLDYSRSRRWCMWEAVASWHRYCRRLALQAMGWKSERWPDAKLAELYRKNEAMCRTLFGRPATEQNEE